MIDILQIFKYPLRKRIIIIFQVNLSLKDSSKLSLRESKYGVFSGPYFPVSDSIQESTDQKKLRIWTLFTQLLEATILD